MRIRNLDTFYWIATLRSFRAAAMKLNLSQPAVSARIQMLEQDLGTTVFLRGARHAGLTPSGRRLLPLARRYMALEQNVLEAFSGQTNVKQSIRLGASETIVATWLPDFLSLLSDTRQGLSFDLMVDSTDSLRNALVSREIDLAFLMGPVAEASITNRELCSFDMIFAATPSLAGKSEKWSVEELAAQPVLTFANNTKPSRLLREMLAQHARPTLDMSTSSSLGALIRLAVAGFGICAIPAAVIREELADGRLVVLPTEVDLPPIAFTASHVTGSPVSDLMAGVTREANAFLGDRMFRQTYGGTAAG